MNNFQLVLFHKYVGLLQRSFGETFQDVVSTDDYMPLTIKSPSDYDKMRSATEPIDGIRRGEVKYVPILTLRRCAAFYEADSKQAPCRPPILKNVPPLLHVHRGLCNPVP